MDSNLKAGVFKTDKPQVNLDVYDAEFNSFKNDNVSILELGVLNGGSLDLWVEYFTNAKIVGIDINHVDVNPNDRVKFYQGDQKDFELLKKVTNENADKGFKVIIDDASHFGRETFESFTYLFKNSLQSGGIYVIEDWGTGFWPHYPDGRNFRMNPGHISYHLHNDSDLRFKPETFAVRSKKRFLSHDYGMVGVVKQLIDEVGMNEATAGEYTSAEKNIQSMIAKVTVVPGLVFIYKK